MNTPDLTLPPAHPPRLRETPLWAEIVAWARAEAGLDWSDDDLAAVIGKIHAPTPDDLPDAIGKVLLWCGAAERSDDEEAKATVGLWRELPCDLIEITLTEDGRVQHRINPDIDVRIEP